MILTLDIGNSRVKWVYWHNGLKVQSGGAEYHKSDIASALALMQGGPRPETVLAACVAGRGVAGQVSDWFERRFSLAPGFLATSRSAGGVIHGYDDPAEHGVDRWAALMGARALTKSPACIIDAGTAVTIDWMDAEGIHQGGLIMPGLKMMREALSRRTDGIPAVASTAQQAEQGPPAAVARSTAGAVLDGTLLMLGCALRDNISRAREHFGDRLEVFVTGGTAPLLQVMQGVVRMRHEPDLVHIGLLSAYQHESREG